MLKSIGVVLGCYILSVLLVMATDPLLMHLYPGDYAKNRVPSTNPLIVSTALFVVISIFCAALCARFAPVKTGAHVLWFMILGEAMGLSFTIANWSKGWPHWYSLAWLIAWPVSCWIGFVVGRRKLLAEKKPQAA